MSAPELVSARPLRQSITHLSCGGISYLDRQVAEIFAQEPARYSHAYCGRCATHRPVAEFMWTGTGRRVGT